MTDEATKHPDDIRYLDHVQLADRGYRTPQK